MTASSPYADLPERSFWSTAVARRTPATLEGLYEKRFDLGPETRIATAGSCFAQHIARHLRQQGFQVLDTEPAPGGLDVEVAQRFGYGLYSARFGNVYTARHLLQLHREAYGAFVPTLPVWERDGRYFDALRPTVEPAGLASPELVLEHRADHLRSVRRLFNTTDVLVFTLGLTEGWVHAESGTVYPTAPGTVAGEFDPDVFAFHNFTVGEVLQDLRQLRRLLRHRNPDVKLLLTVSPVPLTATAAGEHVLTATTYSKSVLRAAAGQLYAEFPDVDYFPSYELIASPASRAQYFASNLRSVLDDGVRTVMSHFFAQHDPSPGEHGCSALPAEQDATSTPQSEEPDGDVVCDDLLLEAFAP